MDFFGLFMSCYESRRKTTLNSGTTSTSNAENDEEEQQPQQPNPVLNTRDEQSPLNVYEKIHMEGISINRGSNKNKSTNIKKNSRNNSINNQTTSSEKNSQTVKKFTYNNLNIIRYAPMLILIILQQQYPRAMTFTLGLLQLLTFFALLWFCVQGEFESRWISALFISFEAVFLVFIVALFITTVAERDPNSDEGFWLGTIPLISLMFLMVLLKVIHAFVTIVLECKNRSTTGQSGAHRSGEAPINPVKKPHYMSESNSEEFENQDGLGLGVKESERKNLIDTKKDKKTGNSEGEP